MWPVGNRFSIADLSFNNVIIMYQFNVNLFLLYKNNIQLLCSIVDFIFPPSITNDYVSRPFVNSVDSYEVCSFLLFFLDPVFVFYGSDCIFLANFLSFLHVTSLRAVGDKLFFNLFMSRLHTSRQSSWERPRLCLPAMNSL